MNDSVDGSSPARGALPETFVRDPIVEDGTYWGMLSQKPHRRPPPFSELKAEYKSRWTEMKIRTNRLDTVKGQARQISSNRDRYEVVSAVTAVPWYVIGVIHSKESGLSFSGHLHNGDPLIARTVLVPAGRPTTGHPPFTWEESAIDALNFDGLAANNDWSIEKTGYLLEKFNGFGYRRQTPPVPTPYLWAFSDQYVKGYYVSDGRYDPDAVARNCGAMPLLKMLLE